MKPRSTRRSFVGGSMTVAGTLAAPGILRAQPMALTVSHFVPPTHWFEVDLLRPWTEAVREKTGGAVEFEIHSGASGYGEAERQIDQARTGVVDIVLGLAGIPPARFPHSSIMELPFVAEDARSGTAALWELYRAGSLGREYDGLRVLALFTHHGALIHTVDRPVRELSDLKSMRIRTPGPAVTAMLDYLGASAIGMPPAQIYESLQKGTLDGVATTWDLVGAIGLNEVLKHHTDARLYVAAFYIAMNRDRYETLPAVVKTAIDETTGDAMLSGLGALWDKQDAAGRDDARRRGNEIITIDDETRAEWRATLQPMIAEYLAGLKAQGVENPEGLYEEALAAVARHAAG